MPDISFDIWTLIASASLVLGVPLAMTMVAGGVVGVVVERTSAARGLLVGLVVGIIGDATNIGALVIAEDHLGVDTGDLLPVMLIVLGVGLVFAAIAAYLSWCLSGRGFWKLDRTV